MSLNGYVKLHRKILDWEWYDEPLTKVVFLHLLLTANFKETKSRGVTIKPGQTKIGRKSLAETLGISQQNVRTALDHLRDSGEITTETTNRYTLVTIVNWASYQIDADEQPADQPPTNHQLTTNQPHRKKDKKDKNDEKIYKGVPPEIREAFLEWVEMRKKIGKPITTTNAVMRAVNTLHKLSPDISTQISIINRSIDHNWLSFYPLPKANGKGKADELSDFYEMTEEWANE